MYPAWMQGRVVVCMDLLQCDGRIFAAASAPLADSYTLLNLAGFSSASQVAVFVPGTPGPIPPGEEVLLSTGDCITFVPPGADIRDRCTLNEVLSSPDGTMYETPPLPRPIEDRFCLVADGFYFDFLLTPERSFLFRQDIGLRLNLAANQVLLSPSQPRIENAQIYGRHCRSVVAVGDRTDSSLSPHCHVGFLDCRPILEGWRRVQAPGGWLNIGVIRDGFMQGAPPGYRVHVGGCLAHWEWLWVEQGQVFRVLFQTDSEDGHLPTHQPSGHSGLEVTLFEDPPGQERRSHEDPSQAAYTSAHNGPGASSHSGRAFASGAFSHICDMWDPDLVHAACLPGALGLTPVYWMFKTSLCLVPRAAVCVTQCTCRRLLIVFAWSMLLDCIEALGVDAMQIHAVSSLGSLSMAEPPSDSLCTNAPLHRSVITGLDRPVPTPCRGVSNVPLCASAPDTAAADQRDCGTLLDHEWLCSYDTLLEQALWSEGCPAFFLASTLLETLYEHFADQWDFTLSEPPRVPRQLMLESVLPSSASIYGAAGPASHNVSCLSGAAEVFDLTNRQCLLPCGPDMLQPLLHSMSFDKLQGPPL